MREKMKAQKTQIQTNPKTSQGMEVFLSTPKPSTNEEVKKPEKTQSEQLTKPSTNTKEEVKQIKINKEEEKETQANLAQNKYYDEIEESIRKIEEQLMKSKTLDITTFNNLAYSKHLTFKLLFITSKIYLYVKNTEGKSVVVAITPPRWGGSSLRYLISTCSTQYCQAIEKQTSKSKIITYAPLGSNSTNDDEELDDIFD